MTKASLRYHFPAKADLGRARIIRYAERFAIALADIDGQEEDEFAKLKRFVDLNERVLLRDRMCLCGMLAAEIRTLPEPMRLELRRFFDLIEAWLVTVFRAGRESGRLTFDGAACEAARALNAALQGAMLIARAYEDPPRFAATAKRLLASLIESQCERK